MGDFPVTSQAAPSLPEAAVTQTGGMVRKAAVLAGGLVAALVVSGLTVSSAHAKEPSLRDQAHARVAAVMADAQKRKIFSQSQASYVLGALPPSSKKPKPLAPGLQKRTVNDFWRVVAQSSGLTASAAQAQLAVSGSLKSIALGHSHGIDGAVRSWLMHPVLKARVTKKISQREFSALSNDITRATDRLVLLPGGQEAKPMRPVKPVKPVTPPRSSASKAPR